MEREYVRAGACVFVGVSEGGCECTAAINSLRLKYNAKVLYGEKNQVLGVATNDVGLDKNGIPKDTFARGMELKA